MDSKVGPDLGRAASGIPREKPSESYRTCEAKLREDSEEARLSRLSRKGCLGFWIFGCRRFWALDLGILEFWNLESRGVASSQEHSVLDFGIWNLDLSAVGDLLGLELGLG